MFLVLVCNHQFHFQIQMISYFENQGAAYCLEGIAIILLQLI